MKRKKLPVLVFLLFVVFSVQGQENWSLEQCVKHALENNPQIRLQVLNAKYYGNQAQLAKAAVLPSLNAGASQNYNFGRMVDPYTNEIVENTAVASNNLYIGGRVNLFTGFQQFNNIKKAQYDLLANLQDLEKIRNDISLTIATAYLQILYSLELMDLAAASVEVTKSQIDRTEKLVNAGSLPRGNLLEVQSQAAMEELQLINAQNQVRSAYLTLSQLLDLPAEQAFEIAIPNFDNVAISQKMLSVKEVYAAAQELPQIKSAFLKLQASEKSLAMAKAGLSPQLSLSANWGTGYSDARKRYEPAGTQTVPIGFVEGTQQIVQTMQPTFDELSYSLGDQYKNNANTSVGINLSIPIFNNLQVNRNIANSKINLESNRLQLEVAKNQLYKEIQQAHADAMAAFSQFYGSQKALDAMNESFKYTQQKFDLGVVTSVDYNLAKNQLDKARSELLQAKYGFIFKKSIIDFYSGKAVSL